MEALSTKTAGAGAGTTAPTPERRWRPGLDGLRALAVLGVIAYHEPNVGLPGGFLGVDLFFVLSGFLITGLLLDEHASTGSISITGFWTRRGRRLLPALAALLLVVTIATQLLGDVAQRHDLPGGVLAAVLYVSNWAQIIGSQSYFARFDAISPLRHLWSLAIEEQFYVVWPVIVIVCMRFGRRALVAVTVIATLASALLMASLFDAGDPSRAYYGTETRASALLIGALAAIWAWSRPFKGRVASSIGLVSLAIVCGALVFVRDDAPWMYREGFLAFSIVAAGLIVVTAGSTITTSVFAHPILRRIGMWSYALYLWHWPIRVLLTDSRLGVPDTTTGRVAGAVTRLGLTFALAITSTNLLEDRARRTALTGRRLAMSWTTAGAVCVSLALLLSPPSSSLVAKSDSSVRRVGDSPTGLPTMLVVGDSVAVSLEGGLTQVAGSSVAVIGDAALGCALLTSPRAKLWDGTWVADGSGCPDHEAVWADVVDRIRPDVVLLLTGAWDVVDRDWGAGAVAPGDSSFDERYRDALAGAIASLGSSGAIVEVVTPPCFAPSAGESRRSEHDPLRVQRLASLQRTVVARGTSAALVDLQSITCDDGFTRRFEGVEWRPDGTHFSVDGSRVAARWLLDALSPDARARLDLP